jgi:ABC-type antimicrobial peptide transport system permease subunit
MPSPPRRIYRSAARSHCAHPAWATAKPCRPRVSRWSGSLSSRSAEQTRTPWAACGGNVGDEADLLLVTSVRDSNETAAAIRAVVPNLHTLTNDEVVGRLQQTGFSYFRQISTVLTTMTVAFAVLLITVLLTVSVNQRLGEIAALRALGFSRRRVIADVLSESALIVGSGGVLSLPLGLLLSSGLDRILKGMPGIPAELHFFVFDQQALAIHIGLLVATAVVAALYPMRIVSSLPIAATLRDEVIG